jgi:hypothetical protein
MVIKGTRRFFAGLPLCTKEKKVWYTNLELEQARQTWDMDDDWYDHRL